MQVVARLVDRGKVKGHTTDFHPEQDHFTIKPPDGGLPVRISIVDLKALFFVHSVNGNPDHCDHKEFRPAPIGVRPKLWIEFKDGEEMAAWPVSPLLGNVGFYVIPTDSNSNVEKAWVNRRFVERTLEGKEADAAAQKLARQRKRESSASWPQIVQL
jgi:hypothetical protein